LTVSLVARSVKGESVTTYADMLAERKVWASEPRWCRECDVKWRGTRVCWCCGKPVPDATHTA